jgi:aspartyl-tRNA(Asn)/glutamyl-tRNA(Gln) amidotransferase subunit B
VTRAMRSKEEAEDYRYFPDPDLPPLRIDPSWINDIAASMPELPDQAQERLMENYGLSDYDAAWLTLTPQTLEFFDQAMQFYHDAKTISNWMMGELSRLLNQNNLELQDSLLRPKHLTDMLQMIDKGTISGKMAKVVFEEMFSTGKSPEEIVKEKGMAQISDQDTLQKVIDEAVAANAKVVEDYKNGKEKAFGFLIGQIMKATRGQANPALVNELLKERLKKE